MLLLALAQIVLVLLSWLITAAMPEAFPRSMLSPEGIRWFFGSFTENMESPWLVGLLLICIAWGTLQTSGLLHFDRTIYRHRNAFRLVLIELVLFIAVILLLTIVPHAILLNVMGGLLPSSFSASIVPYCCFSLMVMSVSFGVMSDRMKGVASVYEALVSGVGKMGGLLLIYVIGAQLYHSIIFLFSA